MKNRLGVMEQKWITELVRHNFTSFSNHVAMYGSKQLASETTGMFQSIHFRNVAATVSDANLKAELEESLIDAHSLTDLVGALAVSTDPERFHFTQDKPVEFETYQPLLYCALANLVSNSLYEDDTSVHLHVTKTSKEPRNPVVDYRLDPPRWNPKRYAVFSVTDDGPGFPKGKIKDCFSHSVTHREDGTGFGLFVVQVAAMQYEGAVSVRSKPGETTVSFYHPL